MCVCVLERNGARSPRYRYRPPRGHNRARTQPRQEPQQATPRARSPGHNGGGEAWTLCPHCGQAESARTITPPDSAGEQGLLTRTRFPDTQGCNVPTAESHRQVQAYLYPRNMYAQHAAGERKTCRTEPNVFGWAPVARGGGGSLIRITSQPSGRVPPDTLSNGF